jgi:ABC-2 type transport system permease protein
MKNILTIFKRELKSYFNSPIAYIFIIVFLFISAGLFMTQFFLISNADMRPFFMILPLMLCIFIPAVSMRLWAEDRRGNTMELLLTFPMNTHEIVIGKFTASLVFYIIALFSTITIPIMLAALGKPDMGAILCQYLGAVLTGCLFLSLGIFISGFCKDQIVSFIVGMIACFVLFFLGTDFAAGTIDGWIPGAGSFFKNFISITPRFDTFQKGVIDTRDLLYFIIGSAIFLTLNAFWLESRLRPKAKSVFLSACVMSFGIFMLINIIISDTPMGRFDCTQGRVHTISKATKEILGGLKAPVTAKLFISPQDKMPTSMRTLERDLRDKLDEIKAASKGRFTYKVFHMEAARVEGEDGSLDRSIERKGIKPFQVQSINADELGVKLVYAALSLVYKEKPEEIIPRITPEILPDLEYMIMSKVYRMTLERTPSLALFAPYKEKEVDSQTKQMLAMFGQAGHDSFMEDRYKFVPQLLEYEGYKVSRIRLTDDEPIPEDALTLIVIEPENLNDRQRFEINKFLVNGGSVFLAVQNYGINFQNMGRQGIGLSANSKRPEVNQLLEKWGLGISSDILMDTEIEVISLHTGGILDLFGMSQPIKTPLQIKIIPAQMNKSVSITSNIPSLFYLWGSAIDINNDMIKGLGLEPKILFSSSPSAWSVPYRSGILTRQDLSAPSGNKGKSFPLAVFVSGQFPDAFDNLSVPAWPSQADNMEENYELPAEQKNLSPKPGKLILTGCSEMFTEELFKSGGHMQFLLNSIDAITLGEKLIDIRSKAPVNRSIKRVSVMAKAGWRFFTVIFVPMILCLAGVLNILMRRRAKGAYLKQLSLSEGI